MEQQQQPADTRADGGHVVQATASSSAETNRRFRHRSEATRCRDVYRHLQPWIKLFRPIAIERAAFPHDQLQPLPHPQACPDTTLTALAQLCAVRLDVRRCLVTLISTEVEYVLVESTRTQSLQYDAADDPKDALWLGTCSFLRQDGINKHAMDGWRKARRLREPPEDKAFYYTEGKSPHWQIFSDLRSDEDHCSSPFVQRGCSSRFYCSVPLRGAQGSVLGSVTLIDDKPRHGISLAQMSFLEDIADTIVQHLDATALRSAQQRSERLIQALGLFNARKDSLREWWQQQEDLRVEHTGRHVQKSATAESRQARIDEEFGTHEQLPTRVRQHMSASTRANAEASSDRDDAHVSAKDFDDRAMGSLSEQPEFVGEDLSAEPEADLQARAPSPANNPKPLYSRSSQPDFVLSQAMERTYARATNLMREALGVDGVVCIDASAITMDRKRYANGSKDDGLAQSTTSDTSGSESGASSGGPQYVKLQGFSTHLKSSISGSKLSAHGFKLAETALHQLVRRYPRGHIFNFGEDGGVYASSGGEGATSTGSADSSAKPAKLRSKEGQRLGKVMVGARSIAFHPLWDDTHERWRSCIFVWSTSDMRYFDENENTTYLSTWGHSLMAELSRLETLAADKAKGTFISSVSHELRSPLHGMLAGVEFLQESPLDAFQQEMTHTINSAGRTLLDTINHILDHSKISNFTRQQRKERETADASRHEAGLSANPNEIGTMACVDLAKLTEETVQSIVSAYLFQSMPKRSSSASESAEAEQNPSNRTWHSKHPAKDLSLSLSIAWRQNWMVNMQPGSWVRVLTNLIGNALKYTARGNISVELKAGHDLGPGPASLVVRDTGIGMTKQFLDNDLYTPFRQEDSHSTGTGLGLSIVKQIVKDMDARIDISSARGEGTKATVRFEACFVHEDGPPGLRMDTSLGKIARELDITGFHLIASSPANDETGNESSTASSRPSAVMERAVAKTAADWLGCTVSSGPSIPEQIVSPIYAVTDDELLKWKHSPEPESLPLLSELAQKGSTILVLSKTLQRGREVEVESIAGLHLVALHQPIGPKKLVRAILAGTAGSVAEYGGGSGVPSTSSSTWRTPSADRFQTHGFPWGTDAPTPHSSTQASNSPFRSPAAAVQVGSRRPSLRPLYSRKHTSKSLNSDGGSSATRVASTSSLEILADGSDDVVLLVEDNDVNMKLLKALMRKLGRSFQCAVNGLEAVDAYKRGPSTFSLVLMDISMPVMDGFAATTKIREMEKRWRLARTKIVALTGVTSAEAKQRAFDCGVDEYFAKPVRMQELRELLQRSEADV